MENEETVELDPINEIEETIEIPEDETGEEITLVEPQKPQHTATERKLYERLKKVEADLKLERASRPAETTSSSSTNVEEVVLLATGMSEELLGELKAIAAVRKTTLIKAQADPIFVAVKEKFEKDLKVKKASIGASRGSGSVAPKKDFRTTGLTREEHKAMIEAL